MDISFIPTFIDSDTHKHINQSHIIIELISFKEEFELFFQLNVPYNNEFGMWLNTVQTFCAANCWQNKSIINIAEIFVRISWCLLMAHWRNCVVALQTRVSSKGSALKSDHYSHNKERWFHIWFICISINIDCMRRSYRSASFLKYQNRYPTNAHFI